MKTAFAPSHHLATTLTVLHITRQIASVVSETVPAPKSEPAGLFPATPWSQLMRLRGDDASAQVALSRVCQMYWYPVYAHIRGRGYAPHDAEDHTQGFFMRILERQDLQELDQKNGRLRSFILASVKNYLLHAHRHDSAQKRGGGRETMPLDVPLAEEKLSRELVQQVDPERLFEQRWAITLLENVLLELEQEHARNGKSEVFQALSGFLSWKAEPPSYADAAAQLGINEQAARVAVHRLRKRYRDLLQKHIAVTVEDPAEVDAELDHLLTVFASPVA
ncbi:MAG: sigma-70 family RNA polymerase sigma factor [Verrucomicrobiaceae bacterium]|nr:sigma-70 family RNA polymerase sigma factor [Verrucomicrobiaceae bacterium]